LDQADHLLLADPRDAQYVGEVLASWASRYVFSAGGAEARTDHVS